MKKGFIGILLILLTWVLLSSMGVVSSLLLPPPYKVLITFVKLLIRGELNQDIKFTLIRWFIGFSTGVVVGVPVGLLLGSFKILYEIFEFPIDFFRSLPVTSLFPLFLLAFGIGNASKIAMVFTAVVFVMIISTAYGVIQAPKSRFLMARVFGANKKQIFKDITIYEALPHIIVGMRITLSISLIVVIISEMFIGTRYGLGQKLFDSYSKNLVAELYAILLLVGLLGYILNKLFVFIENKILFWMQ